jgi:Ni/Co efflux regulator RcnB
MFILQDQPIFLKNILMKKLLIIVLFSFFLSIAVKAQNDPKKEVKEEKHQEKVRANESHKLKVHQDKTNTKVQRLRKKQDNMEHDKPAVDIEKNTIKHDKKKMVEDKKAK